MRRPEVVRPSHPHHAIMPMKTRLLTLAVGTLAFAGCRDATAPTTAAGPRNEPSLPTPYRQLEPRPGHYIVVLKPGLADPSMATQRLLEGRSGAVEHTYHYALEGFAAKLSDAEVEALRQDPRVARVEPDVIVHAFSIQTGATWGIDRIDQRGLPLSGTYSYAGTGAGVNVYILDTGIRYTHTQFGGRAHFAFDAYGGSGSDCNGHGTHVAGTVGGRTYGVAKEVSLYSVRVLQCDGSGPLSSIIAGIDWVTAHHRTPAVANMSLGAPIVSLFDDAVVRSVSSGVTYVVAAGNSGTSACTLSPAHLSAVITVAATDRYDTRPSWSNYGSCVDLFAPGTSITSADYYSDVATAIMTGTSMAAPHVAGIAALYLQAHPGASPAQVQDAVIGNATTGRLTNLAGSANRLAYSGFIGSTQSTTAPSMPSTFAVSCSGQTCQFSAQAYADAGATVFSWYFGDGTQAGSIKVTHWYPSHGSWTVKLVVVGGDGKVYRTERTVTT